MISTISTRTALSVRSTAEARVTMFGNPADIHPARVAITVKLKR